jgi:hypothetical protein
MEEAMRQIRSCLVVLGVLAGLAVGSGAQAEDRGPKVLLVYSGKTARTATERLWAPYGLMPKERVRQITVNATRPVDGSDARKGICIEYIFRFRAADDWVGAYLLLRNGTAWGTVKGPDVARRLRLKSEAKVILRFRARGSGVVTFKIGGVDTGPYPSSMLPAREVKDSPVTLTEGFRDYFIGPFPASEVTNLIDPFCVVTSGLDNPGRKVVRVYVTEVRLEPYRSRPARALPGGGSD